MSDRGLYRGIFSSLLDDAKQYQGLSVEARLTLLTLRLCRDAGPACIFRYYPDVLQAQTGLSARRLTAAMAELGRTPSTRRPWIVVDSAAHVVWIRNGLRFDPSSPRGSESHLKGVRRALLALPRTALLARFCEHYGISMASPHGTTGAIGVSPSDGMGPPTRARAESESESESESEKEKKEPPPTSPSASEATKLDPGHIGDQDGIQDGDRHRECRTCGHQWLGGPRCPKTGEHGRTEPRPAIPAIPFVGAVATAVIARLEPTPAIELRGPHEAP
jgi:hypothetical protein